ncbi:hypothetical protein P4123_23470 [Pseudomonas aeruginosa]|nr:hypothetical protein [Pseudomonas aeruginosa]
MAQNIAQLHDTHRISAARCSTSSPTLTTWKAASARTPLSECRAPRRGHAPESHRRRRARCNPSVVTSAP